MTVLSIRTDTANLPRPFTPTGVWCRRTPLDLGSKRDQTPCRHRTWPRTLEKRDEPHCPTFIPECPNFYRGNSRGRVPWAGVPASSLPAPAHPRGRTTIIGRKAGSLSFGRRPARAHGAQGLEHSTTPLVRAAGGGPTLPHRRPQRGRLPREGRPPAPAPGPPAPRRSRLSTPSWDPRALEEDTEGLMGPLEVLIRGGGQKRGFPTRLLIDSLYLVTSVRPL